VIQDVIRATEPECEHVVLVPGNSPFNDLFLEAGATEILQLGRSSHLVLRRGAGPRSLLRHVGELALDVPRIVRWIRRLEVDLVHTHSSAYLGAALAARLARRPVVVHVHERMDALPPWLARLHRRTTALLATRIVVIARFMLEEWHDAGGKTVLIPNTSSFVPAQDPTSAQLPLIGFLGRVAPRKGIEYLIRALPVVLREVPLARLAIVGGPAEPEDHPYLEALRREARDAGVAAAVEFRGPTDDPAAFLRTLRVLGFVSPLDIAPVTVLQAMAAGIPVVCASDGGAEEFVADGEAGLQVPPRDHEAIGRAVTRVLVDDALHDRLAAGALARFRTEYGWDRYVSRILSLYRELAP
jgi:glycosyltransferase involved in cell wall biosynthesis